MMTDMSETGNQDAGLLAHARARPDHIALREGDRARTYGELDDRARRVAHALASLGVRRGDRVVLWMTNSLEWLQATCAQGLGESTHPAVDPRFGRARWTKTALPRPATRGRVLWSISMMKS